MDSKLPKIFEVVKAPVKTQAGEATPSSNGLQLPKIFSVANKPSGVFDRAVQHIFKSEGGYANDPDDPGGETNFGISSVYNPDVDVKNLTTEKAKQIYKERYWDKIKGDKLPANIRMQVFDTAVNMGVDTAKQLLDQSGGDPVKYLELRKQKYDDIVVNRPKSKKYLMAWKDRATKAANTVIKEYVPKPKPDFDQKLENKFEENKAAEVGLVDGVKPFTPELYEAKQDNIKPFIQEVQTPEGDKTVINVKGLEAQTAFDNNVKDDEAIVANAQRLNLPPALLKQAVDFNKSLMPVQADKNGVESYLFGTLASFNEGLSTVVDAVDQAASLLAQATGFQWKNPLFKDLSKALKSVGKESGYETPSTVVGDVAGSIASFAPDIMMTFLMPEMKLTQMEKLTKGMVTTVPKFPAWLGAKTGLQTYNQTQKPSDLLIGTAKGFTEGLTYHALGILGNEAGMLAKSFGAGQLASTTISGIANGTLFGGHSVIADPEVWNNGNIDWEKAKKSFWTNFGVGLAFHGQKIGNELLNLNGINSSLTRKAYLSYWTSNKDMIQTGLQSSKTQRELRKESNKYWQNAIASTNPVERNQNLLAKAAVDNIILLRPIADMVAKNPKKFRETITNDKRLNDQQKKYFLDKIDDTVEAYKINEETATVKGDIEKDYTVESRPTSKRNIERIVEQADTQEELSTLKYPVEDVELSKKIGKKRKELRVQEEETVKEEKAKKLAEKKAEISEVQPTKLLTEKESLPKVETVKQELYTKESVKQAIAEGKKIPLEVKKQFPQLFIEEAKKVGEQEIKKEEKGLPKSETVKGKEINYEIKSDNNKITKSDKEFIIVKNHVFKSDELKEGKEYTRHEDRLIDENAPSNRHTIKGTEYVGNGKPQDALDLKLKVDKIEKSKPPQTQVLDLALNDLGISINEYKSKIEVGGQIKRIPTYVGDGFEKYKERVREFLNQIPKLSESVSDKTIEKWFNDEYIILLKNNSEGTLNNIGRFVNNVDVENIVKGKEAKTTEEVKQNISKVTNLKEKANEAKSKVKKEKFEKQKEEILKTDEKLKTIDDNMSEIIRQLQEKGKIEIKGPCPI